MDPPPLPFGDPARVQQENSSAVGKGLFLGCGGCGLLVLLFVAVLGGIFAIVLGSVRRSDVSVQAFAKASGSAEVRALLGTPLEKGWTFSGSISVSNDGGQANLNIPIAGPKGSGSLHVEATKENGVWIFHKLLFMPDGTNRVIDLLEPMNVTWILPPAAPYNCAISFSCNPSKPPLLNTMITSPDFVRDFSLARIASVEGS